VWPLLPLLLGSFSKSFPLGPEYSTAVRTNVRCSKHDQLLKCVQNLQLLKCVQNLQSANPTENPSSCWRICACSWAVPRCEAVTTTSTYPNAPAVNRRKLCAHSWFIVPINQPTNKLTDKVTLRSILETKVQPSNLPRSSLFFPHKIDYCLQKTLPIWPYHEPA
jgi:hypothetical protein